MSIEILTSHKHLPERGVHATSLIASGTVRLGSSVKQEMLEAQASRKGPSLLSLGLYEPGNWYLLQARDRVFELAPHSRRFSRLSLYENHWEESESCSRKIIEATNHSKRYSFLDLATEDGRL